MRVVVHVSAFYDWVPVPSDVKVADADIEAGLVKPDRKGGWAMRVVRKADTHCTAHVSEADICAQIFHELIPRPGKRKLGLIGRKEALAAFLAHGATQGLIERECDPSHIKSFVVECDDGPDEQLFRDGVMQTSDGPTVVRHGLAHFMTAKHAASGAPLIDPARESEIVAKYLEPVTHDEHVAHLHDAFGVARAS